MSILVKGVKMPRCCEVCPFNYDYYRCEALGDRFDDREEIDMETQRLPDCPLVEIPPHGRLIDADYMKRHLMFSQGINDCGALYVPYGEIKKEIDRMPTVIESEEEQENE